MKLSTLSDLTALLPDASIEIVGDREELVIYTGWSVDGDVLVPMGDED